MTTTKSRWQDVIGTMRDYLRIGFSGPRLKNVAGVLQVRNSGDSADANLKASLIQLTGGSPGTGKVLGSDAAGNATWGTNTAMGAYQNGYLVMPELMKTIAGGFNATVYNANMIMACYALMTGLNSEASMDIPLSAGTYQMILWHHKGASSGQLRVQLDGVNPTAGSPVEFYNVTTVFNQRAQVGSWTVTDGVHTLNLKITGKHASSTGYDCTVSVMFIQKA